MNEKVCLTLSHKNLVGQARQDESISHGTICPCRHASTVLVRKAGVRWNS